MSKEESKEVQPGEYDDYIDVIILMDVTGSMQRWIDSARNTVLDTFADIQKKYTNSQIRLGLVCYRDYGEKEEKNRFVLHSLTENIQDVQQTLKNIVANGGDDAAEDVAGGLEKVLEWYRQPHPSSSSPTRIVLFVADAPAHGSRYHTITLSDRYPKGDPEGKEPYDQVNELARMDIDLTIFRVTREMDKMIEEFDMAYKDTTATLMVLDVTQQYTSHRPSSSFLSSSSSISSSLSSVCDFGDITSGFIDLASYEEENDKYKFPAFSSSTISLMPSLEQTFSSATQSSVQRSVEKRRQKK
jgi:hypothetical protein